MPTVTLTQWLMGLGVAVAALTALLILLRRARFREKYAALWIVVVSVVAAVAAVPPVWIALAGLLGFTVPANLLFLAAIILLLGVSLHLSWECSKREEETQTVVEELALLRFEVEHLWSATQDLTEQLRDQEQAAKPAAPQAIQLPSEPAEPAALPLRDE